VAVRRPGHNVVLPERPSPRFLPSSALGLWPVRRPTPSARQMIINLPAMHKEALHLLEMMGADPFVKTAGPSACPSIDHLSPAASIHLRELFAGFRAGTGLAATGNRRDAGITGSNTGRTRSSPPT